MNKRGRDGRYTFLEDGATSVSVACAVGAAMSLISMETSSLPLTSSVWLPGFTHIYRSPCTQ